VQIHTMLLRSMQQAIYTATNAGHFGLAYEAYTHFTSPIRRYPDLLVHRVIKAILAGRRYHLVASEKTRKPELRKAGKVAHRSAKPLSQEMELWEAAGGHCSANERRADEASRDVEAWLKCRYMREHLGEEYSGTVSSVASFGLFVTLDSMYVEGLVHITELGGEYYRFDELRQELRGERTGIRYAVGTRVRVQVSRVDLDGRKIDFRMVTEGEAEAGRPARARNGRNVHAQPTPAKNWPACARPTAWPSPWHAASRAPASPARVAPTRRGAAANLQPNGLHPSRARGVEANACDGAAQAPSPHHLDEVRSAQRRARPGPRA
jgi:ribonuclease R